MQAATPGRLQGPVPLREDFAAMTTAYLAAEGYESALAGELSAAGVSIDRIHGRLVVTPGEPIESAWAANIWFDAVPIPVSSIGDAARALRDRQRSWAAYAPEHRGRVSLIAEKLPPLSGRPLELGEAAPASPLGSFTLLHRDLMLVAERCSSPFPNGEVPLAELRVGPPNRAYRKLWEAFVLLDRYPAQGDLALDLGASPGGWTWLLSRLGCHVVAVDRAPLDETVSRRDHVETVQASAFGLEPDDLLHGRVPHWVCSDVACYPERLLPLVERWTSLDPTPTLIFTLKFQGETDHEIAERFKSIRGSRVVHLHHNKHELTFLLRGDRP